MRCPHCQSSRRPPWWLYAVLALCALTVGVIIRTDKEYRSVRAVRMEGDSLLADWAQKKCVPRGPVSQR